MQNLYDTRGASEWLGAHGIKRKPTTLRKLRSIGGGPRFRKLAGRQVYYTEPDLERWAEENLSAPMGSTSEREAP